LRAVVNQNPLHDLRRNAKEVARILPAYDPLIDQLR